MGLRDKRNRAVSSMSYELARKKWRSSGITDEQAKILRLTGLDAKEVVDLNPKFLPVASLHIPYFDLLGKLTGFYRLRYLGNLPGFKGIVEKPQRYVQPAGTLNEVYLPPILDRPWAKVIEDTQTPIYITEGELKAAAGCGVGLATIGLGGVDVWRSSKRGIDLLPILGQINWARNVYIVYDSDASTNVNVIGAQRRLAKHLLTLGAFCNVVSLPAAKDGSKQGLDDYLLTHSREEFETLVGDSPAFPEADALWAFNEKLIFVRDPGIVVERDTEQRMNSKQFVSAIYANHHYEEQTQGKDGIKVKRKPTAQRWLAWERRAEAQRITYAPGSPRIFDGTYNTWSGWGCEPKKGDIAPWKWLVGFLFKSDPDSIKWFEQWCAYPLQHPGTKLFTAVVIWGRSQGTGKTLLAYALMRIYGKNAVEIKNRHLRTPFNSWAENKQFVYGDEIAANNESKRIDSEDLKGMITQETVQINQKFLPMYTIPDVINYIFTSQHPDAVFIEDVDRRYFVHEVVGPPEDPAFYERCDKWLKGDGPSALFHYLLNVDLTGFNPRGHAPMTTAKRDMAFHSKSDVAMWCAMLREDPVAMLAPIGDKQAKNCHIFSSAQLLRAYDPNGNRRVTANVLAREMIKAGFRQVNHGLPVRTGLGMIRLFAVRNCHQWESAHVRDIQRHFSEFFGPDAFKY